MYGYDPVLSPVQPQPVSDDVGQAIIMVVVSRYHLNVSRQAAHCTVILG